MRGECVIEIKSWFADQTWNFLLQVQVGILNPSDAQYQQLKVYSQIDNSLRMSIKQKIVIN